MFALRYGHEITARWMVANGADVKAKVGGGEMGKKGGDLARAPLILPATHSSHTRRTRP